MPKINEETMHDDCEFTCERCTTKAQRVSQLEPELGYVGKLTGEFVQVCQKCWDELPAKDKAMKPIFEAMFIVCIRPDGEPPLITEEGIVGVYKRSPSPYEIKSACKEVASNLDNMDTANRIGGFLMQMQQPQAGKQIISPRRKA